jgi:hypothetical protein
MISPWDAQKSLLLEAAQGTARFELPGSSLAQKNRRYDGND